MKTTFNDGLIDVIPDSGEELQVFKKSIYSDRIIIFKVIDEDTLQEYHFDNANGNLIGRDNRQLSLPKFEFIFEEHFIKGIIEHRFLDELDFKGYQPKGIDIETVVVRLFKNNLEVSTIYHMEPINKFQDDYHKTVRENVERYIESERSRIRQNIFLTGTYSKWTSAEKANYHYGLILFEDRMQGGHPSGYKNPAATYLSKWFIDIYSPFDSEILSTVEQIAKMFEIDTKYLNEMIKFETTTSEWRAYADKLNLLEK